jgi:hypothetical protein
MFDKPDRPEHVPTMEAADVPRFRLSADSFEELMLRGYKLHMTDDAVYYLKREGSFDNFTLEGGQELPDVPREVQEQVGLKELPCPVCRGCGWVLMNSVGSNTGLRISVRQNCKCVMLRFFYRNWTNTVPTGYQNISLDGLERFKQRFVRWTGRVEGNPDRPYVEAWQHGTVEDLIALLREYPGKNYLFVGEAGTGKSTCLVALYQHALLEAARVICGGGSGQESIWKIDGKQLSNEFHAYAVSRGRTDIRDDEPMVYPATITAAKIKAARAHGLRPQLFLEELDKFKLDSDFQRNEFWAIFEELQPNDGQIVTSTNLNVKDLEWRLGKQHGAAIVRRICGDPNGIIVDFTSATITKSWESSTAASTAAANGSLVKPVDSPVEAADKTFVPGVKPPPVGRDAHGNLIVKFG